MNNSSFIIDKINTFLAKSQNFLRPIVSASLFLQRFDYFIMLLMTILFVATLFASTNIMGIIATLIIALTVVKMFFVKGQNIEVSIPSLVLIGFLAVCYASTILSPYVALSFKGLFKTLIYILYYFSMVQFFRFNKNKIVPVIFIMAFVITFESCFAIFQSMNPLESLATWQDTSYVNAEDTLSRVYGTLQPYNPNLLCGFLIVGLASVNTIAFWSFFNKHKKTFSYSIALLIITLVAIFLTGSRGGYLGVFATFLTAFLLINAISKNYFSQKAQKAWKRICTCFLGMAGCAIVFSPAILKRILSIFILRGDSSTSFRMNVYQSTWQMFLDNWFSGIGVGNETFRNMYGLYMRTGFDALSAYSIYLETAVESGIFAFLLIVTFFLMMIFSAIKLIKSNYPIEQKTIVISILIMMSGVFVHGFFDTIFFRPQLQFLFWTNIAIMAVIIEDQKKSRLSSVQQFLIKTSDLVVNVTKIVIKGVIKWIK